MTTTSMPVDGPAAQPHRRVWIVIALIVAAVIAAVWWRSRAKEVASTPAAGARGGAAGAEARPVTVAVASVALKDVPIYLEGLGTVTAYKTVTVRSRVEGQLQSVTFREGDTVKAGALLAQVDPRPFLIQLHTAQAALARDNAQLRGARLNLERYQSVRKEKLIAQQQVDDQQTVVEQQEAQVRSDEAQVESAKLQLAYARITSPIDGVTGVRLVDQGNVVHANDAGGIVLVTQLDPIAVLFTLPQDDLPLVSQQMAKGPLTVTALSRDGQSELGQGQVELVDNQINATTSTIRLKAIFPNPKRVLWPNAFVKARLLLDTRKGARVIPGVAVQRGPKGTFVYVVGADQKASLRNVEVERMEGELALIKSGLESGETVVVDGQTQLRPGATVNVKRPEAPGGERARGPNRVSAKP